jgi:ubiquinone/menaquinone biosynthesis C-methylase UbiE
MVKLNGQININRYNAIRPKGPLWDNDLFYARFIKLYNFAYTIAEKTSSPKGIALDAATGLGYGAKILNGFFENVYGIDISDEALNYAKANYEGPIFRKGNVLNLPFDDNFFEAVFSIETLEHLQRQDHDKYLNELIRVTKQGGLIFISTPNKPIYSSVHSVKDHIGELDCLELKSLVSNRVRSDVEYYQFGVSYGKSLCKLNNIEKYSPLARKIYGRVLGLPCSRKIKLREAVEFWDINTISTGNESSGYLNMVVISQLQKSEGINAK